MLNAMPDTEVVGDAATGEAAITLAAEARPDVVLMDITMPGIGGIEAVRRICAAQPEVRVLMVTMLEDDTVFAALRAGARGSVVKGTEPAEVLRAIRAVAEGESIFSPSIAERMLHFFAAQPAVPSRAAQMGNDPALAALTEREREVLELLASGLTNSAIAERLVISPKTVRNYITEIFSKLQVADRAQAIIRARQAGLGAGEPR